MFRPSVPRLLRRTIISTQPASRSGPSSRRLLTTAPPHKTSRSWKNGATRWALAAGGVYWYNTSPIFNEQIHEQPQPEEAPLPTLDSLSRSQRFAPPSQQDAPTRPSVATSNSPPSIDPKSALPDPIDEPTQTPEDLEAEAYQQGAFNEETGEINWDCPCLGGMANGPCGPEFREAFSCFVFSKDEPKGMDCVDKFKGMQTCFRAHPEEYGDQLEEDEDDVERELAERESADRSDEGSAMEGGEGVAGAVQAGITTALKEDRAQAAGKGGVGAEVTKDFGGQQEHQSEPTTTRSSRRSIYDADAPPATKSDSRTNATNESARGNNKIAQGNAGDEGGSLLPKAAHDATGEGIETAR